MVIFIFSGKTYIFILKGEVGHARLFSKKTIFNLNVQLNLPVDSGILVSICLWVFICHLPFLMGVLAFQLLELRSYSGEGNCLLLKRGACSRDNPPSAMDRGRVSSIGVERIFAGWFNIPHWWKWLLLYNMVPLM